MTSWREVLGATNANTLTTLKQKYRKLALERHPNKPTGTTAAFQSLQRAWENAQRHFASSARPASSSARPASSSARPASSSARPASSSARPASTAPATKKRKTTNDPTMAATRKARRRYPDPMTFKKSMNNYFRKKEARDAEYRRRAITHRIGVVQPDGEVRTFDFLTVRTTQPMKDVFATVVKHAAQIKAAGAGDVMKGFRVFIGTRSDLGSGTPSVYDDGYSEPRQARLIDLISNLNKIPNTMVRIQPWREYVPNPRIPPSMRRPPTWYVPR